MTCKYGRKLFEWFVFLLIIIACHLIPHAIILQILCPTAQTHPHFHDRVMAPALFRHSAHPEVPAQIHRFRMFFKAAWISVFHFLCQTDVKFSSVWLICKVIFDNFPFAVVNCHILVLVSSDVNGIPKERIDTLNYFDTSFPPDTLFRVQKKHIVRVCKKSA